MRGQSSMMAIVIAIVMIMFIAIFLLTALFAPDDTYASKSEYRNLFAHNLLLSVLRTDTSCGTVSEVLKGAYFGGGKCDSQAFLTARLPEYVSAVLLETGQTDYDWFFEASPRDFQGNDLALGNPSVKGSADGWDARTIVSWEGYQLDVKMYMRTKS